MSAAPTTTAWYRPTRPSADFVNRSCTGPAIRFCVTDELVFQAVGPYREVGSESRRVPVDNTIYDRPGDPWWSDDGPLSAIRTALNPGRMEYFGRVFAR